MASYNEKHVRDDSALEPIDSTEQEMGPGKYFATRLTTLKPPMHKAPNPIALLRMLNTQQWLFFLVAFFAWTWDAFDFFTVSLTVTDLAKSKYHCSLKTRVGHDRSITPFFLVLASAGARC